MVSGGTLTDGTDREPLTGATIIARDGRMAEIDAIRQIEIVIRDGRVVWKR